MDQRLFVAARLGDIATLELLLREDPLLLDRLSLSSQENPLHVAAFAGQADFAAKILSLKPELALEPNQQGFSPLHIASASGEIEVVRELLRVKNPDVMCLLKDRDGLIPLHWAAQRGRIDVIKELVLSFPNSLKVESASLDTPLHVAVRNNQVEATKLLLEEIKDHNMVQDVVNRQNREGNTVLHLATLGKQLQIVEMLIGEEAIIRGSVDADRQNRNWLTPKDILDVVIETEGGNVSEMYKVVQMFQSIEARNAKTKRMTPKPIKPSRNPFLLMRNFLDYEIENATHEHKETLLVVATLTATLTFSGILQPPGGFKTEDANGNNNTTKVAKKLPKIIQVIFGNRTNTVGQSIMADTRTVDFTLYAAFNAIGFLISVAMISLLTKGFPLRNWMRLCMISIVATYVIALIYIAPDEYVFYVVVLVLSLVFGLRELYKFIKSLHGGFLKAKGLYHSP